MQKNVAEGIDSVVDGGSLWWFVGISGYGWIRLSIRQDSGLDVVPRNVRLRDGRTRTGTAPAPLSRSVPRRGRAQPGFPGPLHLLTHDGSVSAARARRDGAAGTAPLGTGAPARIIPWRVRGIARQPESDPDPRVAAGLREVERQSAAVWDGRVAGTVVPGGIRSGARARGGRAAGSAGVRGSL